jgi:hypothetical protein
MKRKYRGITYMGWLLCHGWILWLWKKFLCVRHIHLFDECESQEDHYLHCDACEFGVDIKSFDDMYVDESIKARWAANQEEQ